MRNKYRAIAILLLAGFAQGAHAVPFILDFEGVGDNAQILDFYNGGTDSSGNSGANYGVTFGENARGLIDRDAGGSGNFANEPTPDTIMVFFTGSSILNYEPGFDTGFSFFYTTAFDATVFVWDGLNATGNLLGQIDLFRNNTANNCVGDPRGGLGDPFGQFCNFDIASLAFDGIAMSIDFTGAANQVGYDNITFGSTDPRVRPEGVPEPSAFALMALGLVSLVWGRKKQFPRKRLG